MMANTRRTQTQWQQLIDQWNQSDETLAHFCTRHGLSQASFYNWRQKLDRKEGPPSAPSKVSPWQAIQIPQEPSSKEFWQMELVLPGGAVLRIRQD